MQENEFEKQVQQKMDELKLHPSPAVWQKIEVQIKKEKRNRWALIFLPLLLLGALYGGYVLLNSTKPIPDIKPQAQTHDIKKYHGFKDQQINYDSSKKDQILSKPANEGAQDISSTNKSIKIIKTKPGLKIKSDYGIKTHSEKTVSVTKILFKKPGDTLESNNSIIDIKNAGEEKTTASNKIKPGNLIKTEVDVVIDSVEKTDVTANTEENTIKEENIIPVEKKISIKNKSKWNWGFIFSTGISGRTHLFFENGQKNFPSPLNSGGGNSGTGVIPTPSLIKSSMSFITGISAEKAIAKKTKLVTGLNYKLYSTTNIVGSDSASFYRTSDMQSYQNYDNYYHFLELPIGFRFQIKDAGKVKLSAKTGLSISQLISSNALQFNYTAGLYYHDNSIFNKTQISFDAGIDIAFNSKKNQPFLIGPYINYGFSKLAKDGYHKYHLGFIGIKAQLFFKKK